MENDDFQYLNDVANSLNSRGLNIDDIAKFMKIKTSSFLVPSQQALKHFKQLFDQLMTNEYDQKEKGKLLEDLVSALFVDGYPNIFEVRRNCKTSSNEIYIQVNWSKEAQRLKLMPIMSSDNTSFLCECKNYENKADVTNVGKFYSLMCYTKTILGLFISWNGVTGKDNSWKDSIGLIKKLALGDEKYIIVLSKLDLQRIRDEKTNIFELIEDKYNALKNDIDYKTYIKKHEIEIQKKW